MKAVEEVERDEMVVLWIVAEVEGQVERNLEKGRSAANTFGARPRNFRNH